MVLTHSMKGRSNTKDQGIPAYKFIQKRTVANILNTLRIYHLPGRVTPFTKVCNDSIAGP